MQINIKERVDVNQDGPSLIIEASPMWEWEDSWEASWTQSHYIEQPHMATKQSRCILPCLLSISTIKICFESLVYGWVDVEDDKWDAHV